MIFVKHFVSSLFSDYKSRTPTREDRFVDFTHRWWRWQGERKKVEREGREKQKAFNAGLREKSRLRIKALHKADKARRAIIARKREIRESQGAVPVRPVFS